VVDAISQTAVQVSYLDLLNLGRTEDEGTHYSCVFVVIPFGFLLVNVDLVVADAPCLNFGKVLLLLLFSFFHYIL